MIISIDGNIFAISRKLLHVPAGAATNNHLH